MTPDPYRYFRIEAAELVEQLGEGVLQLEHGQPDPDVVARLLRVAHTLKGAARVVRQPEIAGHAHEMEDALAAHRDAAVALAPERVAQLLSLVDRISERVKLLGGAQPGGDQPPPAASAAGAVEPPHTVRAEADDLDDLLDAIGEAQTLVAPLRRGLQTLERVRHGVDLLVAHATAPGGTVPAGDGATAYRVQSIGAELDAELSRFTRALLETAERTERELDEARGSAERLRLVPAGSIFGALHRAVRDAAALSGKQVVFDSVGADIRLDPHVLSAAYAGLLHLVRNAVAHGIESGPDRRATGKPAAGRVGVTVVRRDRRVVFGCHDDGRGFDVEAVRRAAERGGLPTASLDAQQLVELALKGGISTTDTVTEVAGRGVGLDVARDVAERLGGDVGVHTEPGRGTTVELNLPLSLVSLDCMLVEAAGAEVALPLDAVRHSIRLAPDEIARSASGATVSHDGRAIPFLPLAPVLGAAPAPAAGSAVVAVVVSAGARTVAVGVERLLGTAAVVVQAIPELAAAGAVVSGFWLDGDGNPRLVLDPGGVVDAARHGTAAETEPPPRHSVLVIDDSLTTRMLERSILESAGYDVDVAASGEEGLEKAHSGQFALFLVDIEMPGMDGFTFVERTRADPRLRDTPSILVSSLCSPEVVQRGVEAGARLHVAKSEFNQNELLAEIRKLVS